MRVDGTGSPVTVGSARKAARGNPFSLAPDEPDVPDAPEAAASGSGAVAVPAALMGQVEALADSVFQQGSRAVAADRAARRHGSAMLRALAEVQLALLDDPHDPRVDGAQARLAALAGGLPSADDPVLRLVLREISVRAAVELARAGRSPNVSVG